MAAGFSAAIGPMLPDLGFVGNVAKQAVIGGTASVLGGGKFANGAVTGAFAYVAGQIAGGFGATTNYSPGDPPPLDNGPRAYVGGFFDRTLEGPAFAAYDRAVRAGITAEYFTWDEGSKLASWIDANNGNVTVIGHSYGGDTAASVVAQGRAVKMLVTVDPVSWFRPDFAAVQANAGIWTNWNATGGQGTLPNIIAGLGGAWNNAPSPYTTWHGSGGIQNHATIMICPASPQLCR